MVLDVDSVLRRIGQFGPYQIRILVMFMFIFFPITYQTLIMVFAAYEPPWMCADQSVACLESNSSSAQSKVYSTATKPISLYERRCSLNRSDWKFADYNLYEGPHQTIVDEFDLVCSRGFLAWLANAMLFFGWAVGAIVLGLVADKYGRKSVLFPSVLFVLLITFVMAFVKAIWIVVVCRFFVGVFEAGCFLSMFVLATELVGPEKRALAGTMVWFYFTAALMILGLKAYFVRNWRTLMILSSTPWIFILAFWKFIPESVRWLLVNGRKEEAREILKNVAKVNKKEMPSDELYVPVTTANNGILELFKTWKLAKLSLIQFYAWFVHGVLYYGLSLSSGEFGGSIYLNFALTSLVEMPSHVLAIDNCNRFGRKKTTVAFMVIAGVSIVAVSFIPAGTENTAFIAGRVALGMLGKLFITASFDAVYVFSAELFPTVVRNSGMGMVSLASHVGGACSPFVVQMTRLNAILPFAFMGGLSFIAALLCWVLPETLGKRTPEVMEDTEMKQDKEPAMDPEEQETKQETNV
ncbi:organic cation transporter protein-like [Oculina patagonica]